MQIESNIIDLSMHKLWPGKLFSSGSETQALVSISGGIAGTPLHRLLFIFWCPQYGEWIFSIAEFAKGEQWHEARTEGDQDCGRP